MRIAHTVLLPVVLTACAATHSVAPREYLDEDTGATITAVAEPWVFAGKEAPLADSRDYLSVYAISVNRSGSHQQYLAVLNSVSLDAAARPTLELRTDQQTLSLSPVDEAPRKLGIAQPLAPSYTLTSKWWYFPVDKAVLAVMANSQQLDATLVVGDKRVPYAMWRDGRAEAVELTSVLP